MSCRAELMSGFVHQHARCCPVIFDRSSGWRAGTRLRQLLLVPFALAPVPLLGVGEGDDPVSAAVR
jgi:hypothetical protein